MFLIRNNLSDFESIFGSIETDPERFSYVGPLTLIRSELSAPDPYCDFRVLREASLSDGTVTTLNNPPKAAVAVDHRRHSRRRDRSRCIRGANDHFCQQTLQY